MHINCKNCNKDIERPLSKIKRCKNLFCSYKCRAEFIYGIDRVIMSGRTRKEHDLEYFLKHKKRILAHKKEYRHKIGESKKYIGEHPGFSKTKEYKRLSNQAYKRRVRLGGKLSIKTIQLVYEENIKKYGRLTCYLCLQPIDFGKDCLEHRIPLLRNGTNEKDNLAIAHRSCNSRKRTKTDKEYLEVKSYGKH